MICRILMLPAFLFGTCAAGAQLAPEAPLGSRIPVSPENFPIDKTREVMRAFAECSVKKRPALAHDMVLDLSKREIDKRFKVVADSDCLVQATLASYDVTRLQMSIDIFRSAVAEALIKKNLKAFDALQIRQASPLSTPVIDYQPKPGTKNSRNALEQLAIAKKKAEGAVALTKYGECVVRTDPVGSRRLLDSKVNSETELAALQQLVPAFGGCLDRGAQFRSDRAMLRGAIALNFYRLAYAPRTSASAAQAVP